MKILLSNDDGYLAPGLKILADHLASIADLTVVAPDRNRSGASNSLTLEHPLRVNRADNGFYFVDGTPTDCVHLGITGLLDEEPDMVVSGINAGPNMGDDVLYSGTVAAAMEGRFLGLPALALSMNSFQPSHFETGARVALDLVKRLAGDSNSSNTILNVNIPDVPWDELNGYQVTRLGHRHRAEPVVKGEDPRGRAIYWVGPAGEEQDAGPGTDFYALRQGAVAITPLQVDLTQYDGLEALEKTLSGTPML